MEIELGPNALPVNEYDRILSELLETGTAEDVIAFQKKFSVVYADPIPEQDKEILKDMEVPELPDDIEPILM